MKKNTIQRTTTLLLCSGFILIAMAALLVLKLGIDNVSILIPLITGMVLIIASIFLTMKNK